MTHPPAREEAERIAEGLSAQDRDICLALCGNAWRGQGDPSPGLKIMNAHEFIHIDMLKDAYGKSIRYKARPTPLGLEVRAALKEMTEKCCERCGKRSVGYDLLDFCGECSRDLCDACMAEGCCDHVPAISGSEQDDEGQPDA